VAAVVAGCATVPTSGPVERHTQQAPGVNSGVHVDPLPPADGASQLLVVEGFLHAMSVYQPDYAVARQYLSESVRDAWRPESGVQVYADGVPPAEYGLSAPVTGTIDSSGVYRPGPGQVKTHNFQLVKNPDGQWRISNPPEGLLVSRYVFTTSFVGVTLNFLDTTGSVMVPDPRFFASGDQAYAAAVRAELAGPSAWLAPAVRKPASAGVTVTSVTVDESGTADVMLGGSADRVTGDQRRELLAQLAYTLTSFSQVTGVRVTAGSQVWRADDGQARVAPGSFAQLKPRRTDTGVLFLLRDHKLVRVRDPSNWGDLVAVGNGLSHPEQIAVSDDLAQVAAVSAGGTRLESGQAGTDKAKPIRSGTGLLRPLFARNGELWSPASSGPSAVEVFKGDEKLKVTVTDLPKDQVRALTLSPDGSRVAMILRRGGVDSVGLARVERSEGAVTLGGWQSLDLALSPGSPAKSLDLGWASATELDVLRTTDSQTSVMRVSQDGAVANDVGSSESGMFVQLAVAPGSPSAALAAGGDVYRAGDEFTWNLAVTGVDAVAYSG
jgi:hypothetical protein